MSEKPQYIIRVFPSKTKATPDDNLCFYDEPGLWIPEADEVHISCTFTWDIPRAEYLFKSWERVGIPVKLGGPAFKDPGGAFLPGLYMKPGYVLTSRGCNNNCWFCFVPKREGKVRELTIKDGWLLQDSNLLQCSEKHIRKVFEMLKRQNKPIEFTGGFEAKILQDWHVELMSQIKIGQVFFAYDTPDDYEYLANAAKLMNQINVNWKNRKLRCYVLIGYPKDTIQDADKRLRDVCNLGFMPAAMFYRNSDDSNRRSRDWMRFNREWSRPAIIASKMAKSPGGQPELSAKS